MQILHSVKVKYVDRINVVVRHLLYELGVSLRLDPRSALLHPRCRCGVTEGLVGQAIRPVRHRVAASEVAVHVRQKALSRATGAVHAGGLLITLRDLVADARLAVGVLGQSHQSVALSRLVALGLGGGILLVGVVRLVLGVRRRALPLGADLLPLAAL